MTLMVQQDRLNARPRREGREVGRDPTSVPSCSAVSRPSLRWPLMKRPALTRPARVGVDPTVGARGKPAARSNQRNDLQRSKRSLSPFPLAFVAAIREPACRRARPHQRDRRRRPAAHAARLPVPGVVGRRSAAAGPDRPGAQSGPARAADRMVRCRELTLRAMYGRRPRCKRNLTFLRRVRVQPCIRPLDAAAMAAGPDVIR